MPTLAALPTRGSLARRPRRRLRVALRRQPIAFWCVVLIAALAAWWVTSQALALATAGAAAYGDLVPVVVVARDLEPGAVIGAGDATIDHVPADLVPADSLGEVPHGAVVREPLLAGEALATARLAPAGAIGVAAALALDERAVGVPVEDGSVPLREGQRVDVLATTDPSLTAGGRATTTIAASVRVLAVDDAGVTLAVPEDEAADIATALATAIVTIVIAPD